MNNFARTAERVSNIAVIVVFLALCVAFAIRMRNIQRAQSPQPGDSLPEISGFTWNTATESVVLVLRKGCHYCEDSMPFYRRLYELEKNNAISAKLVAILPDSDEEASRLLRGQNLPIPVLGNIDPARLKVSGTPTLILVDRNRKVERSWVGELDSSGRDSVLAMLTHARPGTN